MLTAAVVALEGAIFTANTVAAMVVLAIALHEAIFIVVDFIKSIGNKGQK